MMIPAKIEGLPYKLTFQFDLGSPLTMIYERGANSVILNHKDFAHRLKKLKSILQFWDRHKSFKDLTIKLENTRIHTSNCFVWENYGKQLDIKPNDTSTLISIGTIGADLFQKKALVIDYPNKQFAIFDSLPERYNNHLIDIELDRTGRVILPMIIKEKHYRIMFDNGSSVFPLITLERNISKFSTTQNIDTLKVSSWGRIHEMTSKMISDTLDLAGQKFSNVKIYSNNTGLGMDVETDGMA